MSISAHRVTLLVAGLALGCQRGAASAVPPLLEQVASEVETYHLDHPPRARLLAHAEPGVPVVEQAQRMLQAEVDASTRLLPRDEAVLLLKDISGEDSTGVGLPELLSLDLSETTHRPTVVTPLPDSSSARAGVRPGDVVVGVDGSPTREWPFSRLMRRIRGPRGVPVALDVLRGAQRLHFVLMREPVVPTEVAWGALLEETVGYARLAYLRQGAAEELRRVVKRLEAEKVAGIVLDLRDNPGGLMSEADRCLEVFMAAKGAHYSGPLVVLVNEGTASASELIAGTLQAQGRARLVGARTFGKGLVHHASTLQDGALLLVTSRRLLVPGGKEIRHGLQPDVPASTPETPSSLRPPREGLDDDPQVEAGLRLLAGPAGE